MIQKMTIAAMQMADMKGMGASVVACVDARPVLEPTKHDPDLVTLPVQRGVVRAGDFAAALGRDAGGGPTLDEGMPKPFSVTTRVADQVPTREYIQRRTVEGKSPREIRRCLKRNIAREIYQHLCAGTWPLTITEKRHLTDMGAAMLWRRRSMAFTRPR